MHDYDVFRSFDTLLHDLVLLVGTALHHSINYFGIFDTQLEFIHCQKRGAEVHILIDLKRGCEFAFHSINIDKTTFKVRMPYFSSTLNCEEIYDTC